MQLRATDRDGVAFLEIVGDVATDEAAGLARAVREGIEAGSRGVVLDLAGAGELAPEAVDALNWLAQRAPGWPRTALAVCCASADLRELLLPGIQVHDDVLQALAHVDDRTARTVLLDVELAFDESSPASARKLTRQCAVDHRVALDDLLLVVSELVTNAVRHGQAPVRLAIDSGDRGLTVVVEDGGLERPRARAAGEEAEGGRGLLLVQLLAEAHGVRPRPPGKTVWAEMRLTPA